jgi:UDP-glucose 4-epimerase
VIGTTKSGSDLQFVPYEQVYNGGIEDMLHRIPSIEKIAAAIAWRPTRDLDVILNDVIKHTLGQQVRIDEPAAAR